MKFTKVIKAADNNLLNSILQKVLELQDIVDSNKENLAQYKDLNSKLQEVHEIVYDMLSNKMYK
jgi:hypothetical protein